MDTKDIIFAVILLAGFSSIYNYLKNISGTLHKIFMCIGGHTYSIEYKLENGMIAFGDNCYGDLWENTRMISNKLDKIAAKHLETYPCNSTYRIDDDFDDEDDYKEYDPDIQSIVVLLEGQERQLNEIITLLKDNK